LRKTESSQATASIEQLAQTSADEKAKAKTYAQIAKVKRPHFLKQCELLWLWKDLGGDLKIITPRKRGGEWPAPHGAVIPFFQAAAIRVFGKTPDARQIKDIVRDFKRLYTIRLAGKGTLVVDAKVIKPQT
jgi:hypothetical protein